MQGGAEHSGDCTQRSYPLVLEAESDLPAKIGFQLLIKLLHCVVSNLHGCHNLYCLHQNLPQAFAEPCRRQYFDFLNYFAETMSYLICMFQDSVPAGSYNDPFLSSVISMVAPTWCHGAI